MICIICKITVCIGSIRKGGHWPTGGKRFANMDAWVRAKMDETGLGYDDAYEEVVADAMEGMLADGKVMEKLAKLKKKDRDVWQKIKDFIDNWSGKLKEAYSGLKPDSAEGKAVLEMTDKLEEIQQLFAEGLVEASENYQASQKAEAKETEPVAMAASAKKTADTESNENVKYSKKKLPPKTFKNGQNANGEFYSNVLVDLADMDSQWWTGTYNHVILSMSNADDTEFRQVYQEIEKRTRNMDENQMSESKVDDTFVVKDGQGREYIYIVELDGYLHGVILGKIDKAKHEAALRKAMQGGKYGQSNADLSRRIKKHRHAVGENSSADSRIIQSGSKSGYGGVDYFESEIVLGRNDGKKEYADQKVHTSDDVKNQTRSDDNLSNRSLLMRVDESSLEHPVEAKRLAEYKNLVEQAEAQEKILDGLNQQIREEVNQKQVKKLQIEAKQTVNRLENLDRQILRKEAELETVLKREQKMAYLQGEQKRADAYEKYRIETEVEHLKTMREYRATRAELHDLKDDTKVMEYDLHFTNIVIFTVFLFKNINFILLTNLDTAHIQNKKAGFSGNLVYVLILVTSVNKGWYIIFTAGNLYPIFGRSMWFLRIIQNSFRRDCYEV